MWSGERHTKFQTTNSSNRSFLAWSVVQNWTSRLEKRKPELGTWKVETWQCPTIGSPLIRKTKFTKNSSNMRGENWKNIWTPPCRARKRASAGSSRENRIDPRKNPQHPIRSLKINNCIVEAHESTRQRVGPSLPKNHEDHIAGKGQNSMNHYNLVHKFSNAASDENAGCKGSSGRGMGKIRDTSSVAIG